MVRKCDAIYIVNITPLLPCSHGNTLFHRGSSRAWVSYEERSEWEQVQEIDLKCMKIITRDLMQWDKKEE